MQFAYTKEGVFVEQSTLADIDFERNYLLMLTGNEVEDGSY